mmetsp:Transcript_19363/g.38267  ORF Transcript_19363/g.38267 Transcript_19363/m.38267 type:complete len:263 (-) Transcript_19363:201-989(-)
MVTSMVTFFIALFCFIQLQSAASFTYPEGLLLNIRLSSTSCGKGCEALSAYHFGVSDDTKTKKKSDNFPYANLASKSYVPDGLTEEEYRKIKENDLAKLQGKNFGAWGPRFKLVDGDPQGNWFSISSLWISGFLADQNGGGKKNVDAEIVGKKSLDTNGKKIIGSFVASILTMLRRYAVAYLILLLSANVLANTLTSKTTKLVSGKWIAARLILPLLVVKPIDIVASFAAKIETSGWFSRDGTTKLATVIGGMLAVVAMALR